MTGWGGRMLDRLFGAPLYSQYADFRLPPEVVLTAAEGAIKSIFGMTVDESLPIPDAVARRTSLKASRREENVRVTVAEPEGGFTRTVVSSAVSMFFRSRKRAHRNVEQMLVEMSRLLDEHGEEWASESAEEASPEQGRLEVGQREGIARPLELLGRAFKARGASGMLLGVVRGPHLGGLVSAPLAL
jgi:hypothetical protein